jgi:pimeloyl-ACP methyl ester carboxylesterase
VAAEIDLTLPDGAELHAYDTGQADADLVVVWHHGTPNTGEPPRPLFGDSERLGIRWISYDRPGYGGSTPAPDRPVGSAATYTAAVTDALNIERFAVMGHSGGGAHALACGALLPGRVSAVVSISSMAPYDADGLDYFGGMNASGVGALKSAAAGRAAKEHHQATADEYDPEFIAADWAALSGDWSWFNTVVRAAQPSGPAPAIDDDLAYTAPWGFDPADIPVPVLVVHGARDSMIPSSHGEWLARRCPRAELWLRPEDGHISVMSAAASTLEWLKANAV